MRRTVVVVAVLATVAGLLPVASAGGAAATTALGAYRATGALPFDGAALVSAGATIPRVDSGVHDSSGVRMVRFGDRVYDHPVAQAQYGLLNLTTYRVTNDPFYLSRAVAQANRLVSRRVESGGAWFFPYGYDYALHSTSDVERAPWYSAMAQGLALALFCRLYSVTHDERWRLDATAAFASLTRGPSSSAPWVSRVDANGYLWLEEYPLWPPQRSDRTYNGFMYALMGVYEYWLTTRSPAAAQLFGGGIVTVRDFFGWYRQSAWLSHYCLAHPSQLSAKYHWAHEGLLLSLYSATHLSVLAADADLLRWDYPPPAKGTVAFSAGAHTGYTFTSAGAVVTSRSVVVTRPSQAPADARVRIHGRGIYYRIAAGGLAGFWVAESRPQQYLVGLVARHTYSPARTAVLAKGGYVGNVLDATGRVVSTRSATFTADTTVTVPSTGWLNGYPDALVASGPLAGTWVPMTGSVRLR